LKRIAVIGAGGAGKTRLARALGQALGHMRPAPDRPPGVRPKVDRRLLADVLTFRRRPRPVPLAQLDAWDQGGGIIRLSSRRAVRWFLSCLQPP
jgi:hypothetical protein